LNHLFQNLTQQQHLLLCSSLPETDPSNLKSPLKDIKDWDGLLARLRENATLPLFYQHLSQHDLLQLIPEEIREKMKVAKQRTAMRNLKFIQVFTELAESFQEQKIEFLPVKGITYLYEIYHDPSLRPMIDIDLLIREKDIPKVKSLMTGLEAQQHTGLHSEFLNGFMHHIPPFVYKHTLLEFHTRFFRKTSPYSLSPEAAWKTSVEGPLYQQQVRLLYPEYHLVYITLHAYNHLLHGKFKLIWLTDVIRYTYKKDIDWKKISSLLKTDADQKAFYGMMGMAGALGQVGLPGEINKNLKDDWTQVTLKALNNHIKGMPHDAPEGVFRWMNKLDKDDRKSFVKDILFPSRAFLEKKYRIKNHWAIMILYPYHALYKLLQGGWYLFKKMLKGINSQTKPKGKRRNSVTAED